jgi:hypothetical protein
LTGSIPKFEILGTKRKIPPKRDFSFPDCRQAVQNYARRFAALRFFVFLTAFFAAFRFFAMVVAIIGELICRPVHARE